MSGVAAEGARGRDMLLNLSDVTKIYNGAKILDGVSLTVNENDRIGIVGNNGCGKTTLLNIITGKTEPDRLSGSDGVVYVASKTSVGYLEQTGGLNSDNTVVEEMNGAFEPIHRAIDRLREIELDIEKGDDSSSREYQQLSSWIEANDGYNTDVKIRIVLGGMGFSEKDLNRTVSEFSGGEKTRLRICRLLLEQPNLLILDEPTNHLDFKTVMWLEDYLSGYKGAVITVSHDRFFLDRVCNSICEIERGRLKRYRGNYTAFARQREEDDARAEKEYVLQQKQIAKLEEYVEKNIVRASTSKSAQSRRRQLEKTERKEKPFHNTASAKIHFTYAMEPPFDVLKVKGVDISVGEGAQRKTLVPQVDLEVHRGEKIGIIGDNGIGKSTLLKILLGKLPHSGTVRWNSNVRISYFEQESANLDKDLTVMDELHERYPSLSDSEVRNLLAQVGIVGENVFRTVGVISGGERAKLCFAIMMREHANVLILDEPTNHLDIFAKESIENALAEYTGTVIFVSHDRYLLSRIADRIVELKDGECRCHGYGFDRYLQLMKEEQEARKKCEEARRDADASADAKERSEKYYRSKQQRSADAARKAEIKRIEDEIGEKQAEIDRISREILTEEVYSDYEVMGRKCRELEDLKNSADELFDRLVELDE